MNPRVHEWTGPTGVHFRDIEEPSGTYYREGTPRPVIDALERARESGARVRVFLGDAKTGRCWGDNWNVTGRVGRSTGSIPIPLLIASRRSMGGGVLMAENIVRLLINGREVYRHPGYELPVYQWALDGPEDLPVRVVEVKRNGARETVAQFATQAKADRWMAFMEGRRMGQ